MRRLLSSITLALGVVGLALGVGFGPVWAAPSPTPAGGAGATAPTPGKAVCTVADERLAELSGLVATRSGYIVVNDSTTLDSRKRVFYLDRECGVVKSVRYTGRGPRDPEDLAVSPDNKTLWIADTGDNPTATQRRTSVVLWSMPIGGGKQPVLHRLAYADGTPRDAEALLIGGDGRPVIITKTGAKAELFVPSAVLKTDNEVGVPLEKAGELTLPKTTTPNILGAGGRASVTGAARSPDGTKIVLRTYADAFEWDLVDGDVVKTLTGGARPRITGLTDPFGEAISYSSDGKQFLTVSDAGDLDLDVSILSYAPATDVQQEEVPAATAAEPPGQGSWTDRLSLQDITYLIAAVGLIGALLVGAGIFGILRARRRGTPPKRGGAGEPPKIGRQAVPAADSWDGADPSRGDPYEPIGGRTAGAVYGGAGAPVQPAGGVYGAKRPGTGGVYGAGRSGPPQGSGGYGGYGGNGGNGGNEPPPDDGGRGRGPRGFAGPGYNGAGFGDDGYPGAGNGRRGGGFTDHGGTGYGGSGNGSTGNGRAGSGLGPGPGAGHGSGAYGGSSYGRSEPDDGYPDGGIRYR
jgi:hypothetical protein